MIRPYSFRPLFKETIWAGAELSRLKGVADAFPRVGESWELSGLPGQESVVLAGGIDPSGDRGLTLTQLIEKHKGSLLGEDVYARHGLRFPLLAKFIDTAKDLSLQVHPNDRVAMQRYGCMGKNEMWYIIKARTGAKVHIGLRETVEKERFMSLVQGLGQGEAERVLSLIQERESREGDVFNVDAGQLHSIGGGNLLAEIQQASDITYRVYDYGRLDSNGKPRELHVDLARDAIDYTVGDCEPLAYDRHSQDALLLTCPSFTVRLITLDGRGELPFPADSFTLLMCVGGEACVGGMRMRQCESLLVPAVVESLSVEGRGTLLAATV